MTCNLESQREMVAMLSDPAGLLPLHISSYKDTIGVVIVIIHDGDTIVTSLTLNGTAGRNLGRAKSTNESFVREFCFIA
jgi:hypothetical protein